MNLWGQAIRNQYPTQPLRMAESSSKNPLTGSLATKRVGPVGDHWTISNGTKMETYSFYVSWPELTRLQSKITETKQIPPFESICTAVWKSVAKVKHGSDVKLITICRTDPKRSFKGVITNTAQTVNVVRTDSVHDSSPMELGLLIMNQNVNHPNTNVAPATEPENDVPDVLVYGSNLTFVDLHSVPLYELDVRGHTPVYVNCAIDNVGDEGVVLIFPARKDNSGGLKVSITLPENDVSELKSVLKKEWSLF